ncbi:hypothetical protein CLAIMM_05669 [Cladophialophora immunda]|nr:hypothetical protein CLAIMM_05669 [Cladophialophora immunda]
MKGTVFLMLDTAALPKNVLILIAVGSSLILTLLTYIALSSGRRSKDIPHGPPTLPIIGNLHQIPRDRAYLKFAEWAKQYGGLYSVKFATKYAFVLTDRRLVKELMDKKSSVSSNRPYSIMEKILYEHDEILLMQASNPQFRIARKFLHQNFMASVVEKEHMPLMEAEAAQLLRDLCLDPADFLKHTKRFGNSFVMSIGYGIRTPHTKVKHMVNIEKVLSKTTTLLQPGTVPPVELFPFLSYFPQRLWNNWRNQVADTKREINALYAGYLDTVVKRRQKEGSRNSFADRLIEQQNQLGWNWHQLYFMAGLLMEAGSDTIAGSLNVFIHFMIKYPEVAKRIQDQIDSVVGDDRSPTFADFSRLPLVNAVIKESLRLRPIAPMGFPHALAEDVWLDGQLLPKGSDIIVNIYGLHRDPSRFPDPETLNLDNFVNKPGLADDYSHAANYNERDHYAYGTGRRLCPGIHVAERALFVAVAKILWAFDISPALDAQGKPVEVDLSEKGYGDGIIVVPLPFECSIKVRSDSKKATIMDEFAKAEKSVFSEYQVPKDELSLLRIETCVLVLCNPGSHSGR